MKPWLPVFPAYATPLDKLGWWALRGGCVGVLAFLLLPILVIIPLSFSDSSFLAYPIPGWSLKWYRNLFESVEWTRAARNSFIVAPAATLLATSLGTMAAVGLARTDFPGKGLLMSLLIAPMVVPIVVVGVSTYLFFANIGLADTYFGKARKFVREGDYFNAIQYGKLAISYNPVDARYYFLLADCQVRNPEARWQRLAEQNYIKAAQLDSWNAEYLVSLGRFYKRRGLKLRARKQFEQALQIVPAHAVAMQELETL